MSLISDTDFLIHNLRLSYLREVDDPYGPRVISLDPSYHSNPYILAASLADSERWPQLMFPNSPNLSEDEQERPSGFPGARLKHTQTIMGGKSGALGLRVNARVASSSKRMSSTPKQEDVKNFISGRAPVQEALESDTEGRIDVSKSVAQSAPDRSWIQVDDNLDKAGSPEPSVMVQQATAPEEVPVAKVVQFIPKFKGAAEMERRRRMRMAARRGPGGVPAQPAKPLSFDTSSEEEDEVVTPAANDSWDDSYEDVGAQGQDMDEGDEFDPVFAASRPAGNSDSASDINSVFSGNNSIPSSSVAASSSFIHKARPRLSPVSEHKARALRQNPSQKGDEKSDAKRSGAVGVLGPRTRGDSTSTSHSVDNMFTKKKVAPVKQVKSSLSAMLASSGSSNNPFAEMYAAISGRGESASTNVQIYFPHARQPAGKPMDLNVRKDATVEEVIGFALWNYWEEGWLPKLDEGINGSDDPKWAIKISAVGWILRIAEDDGEVDDDFPPPDRMGRITKFQSDAYAILEATASQVTQNQILETKIQRRPSRTTKAPRKATTVPTPDKLGISHLAAMMPGTSATSLISGSLTSMATSHHGPQIFLRIRVEDRDDAVHISTTIPVSAGMYMQEALELVCRRRKLANPADWALLLIDNTRTNKRKILIPLDRTVASLQGKRELLLVSRAMIPFMDVEMLKGSSRTTDPNASIFTKSIADDQDLQTSSVLDYRSAYKKYTIYRKMPMLVARQERTLAIDGVYIHIMPVANKAKAVFDSGKTSSYHIKSIADCQQSTKASSIFKLVLNRGAGNKRYDFEAESPKLAAEIVQTIMNMKAALERSGTLNKSRRSRQVV
ncbi:stress-activated map kinase interacting protein 1-domain-containing protein [Panaeolus papilionaceus]|nr:stress-activated map kinase interacting protein 1-domain-containing protein [Panaeolus papilionaceus]